MTTDFDVLSLAFRIPGDTGLIVSMLIMLEQSDAANSGPSRETTEGAS
jgi:hypothetical protein